MREQPVDTAFARRYPSRVQPIYSGSYARVPSRGCFKETLAIVSDAVIHEAKPGTIPVGR